MKLKSALIFLFAGFFVFACSSAKTDRRNFIIADSKSYEASVYRQNCAICHGSEANGKEIDGKLIPSLRIGEIEKKSEEEIYLQIRDGKDLMPSFEKQLTEKEIRRMAQFIRRDLLGKE